MDFKVDVIGISAGTSMHNLAAGRSPSHAQPTAARDPAVAEADDAESNAAAARMIARARWLMIASGLTTLIALAAVIGVIGYRVFHAGGGAVAPLDTVVALPKGGRITSSTVTGDRIVMTLDIGGVTEIRTFDLKTLKETGRLRFAIEP
jgi:hypothetical protein